MNTLQDVRYAFRMLLKRPGFTVIVVLTLALGIGANTTIFSAIDAVLLNPLPYKDPERLMVVWETNKQLGPEMWDRNEGAIGNFLDWRSRNQIFDQLGALFDTSMNLTGVGEPQRIQSCVVTTNFFQVLGVQPMLGRSFVPESETPGSPFTVIISHDLWQRLFNSDTSVIGKSLTLNAHQVEVIGVMPPGFELQFPITRHVDMWVPFVIDVADPDYHDRGHNFLYTVGRLKQGVSQEQAQTEMNLIAGQLQQQYPETNAEKGVRVVPLHKQLVGNVESYLYMLFAAVGFLLLIACANVAGLLLARVTARHREVAIRIAVGASRWRLIRQLLTESVILSALSGLLGLLLAYGGVKLLVSLTPSEVPRLHEIGLHVPVFLWTLAISVVTGVLFGLAPAIQASRPDLNTALKESSGRNPGSFQGSSLRNLLVVSEVAVALLLLVGAGLMTKSFLRLQQVDPGFDATNVVSMNIALPTSKYREPQLLTFYDQLFERVKNLPGVKSVAAINPLPLGNSNVSNRFVVEGAPFVALADRPFAGTRVVTPDYFQTMSIPQLKGRSFTEQDREKTPNVIIVNEALASRYWPNQDPIGKRLGLFEEDPGKQEWREIVGVVGNVRSKALEIEVMPEVYFPYRQIPENFMNLVVRTASDPVSMVPAIRSQVLSVDKDQPVSDIMTMEQRVAKSVAAKRFVMSLLGAFSILALGLAAVGIYGVMAYLVTQRTQEIGVRMALGAQKRDVLRLVVGKGMVLAVVGTAIGLVASLALTRLMRSLLFEVTPTDWLTFVIVSAVLLIVALLACYIPARRATKVDPLVALRYE
ncbi:MAG TPA: ABC transporter permease [Pyrinomonadaceae bacterium]|nr:ABC transporter permease [Pyrinomonadaceae bacterium]